MMSVLGSFVMPRGWRTDPAAPAPQQELVRVVVGRPWRGTLLLFGEVCLVRKQVDKLPSKSEARWFRGMYVGQHQSNAHILLTGNGGNLAEAFAGRLYKDKDREMYEEPRGTPWHSNMDGRVEMNFKRRGTESWPQGITGGQPEGKETSRPEGIGQMQQSRLNHHAWRCCLSLLLSLSWLLLPKLPSPLLQGNPPQEASPTQ